MQTFDLIVIGTGPAGEKGAVKAAYFGHKVAIVEKENLFGGAETITGTLPSKTLKETALFLSGKYEKGLYSVEKGLVHEASIEDFLYRKNLVKDAFALEIKQNLLRHNVTLFKGIASFEDPHTIAITDGQNTSRIRGNYILIATGSYPHHPPSIPFDKKRVHDSDTILMIDHIPKTLAIVGAGVIGCEYATIFATMGSKVYLINDKDKILYHVDDEIIQELVEQMKMAGVEILFNKKISSLTLSQDTKEPIHIALDDKTSLKVDMFLFAAGRSGNIADLGLDKAGVITGPRETILVDKNFKTNVDHIFAAGDVVGFPALASTSMEQGRVAVSHMFKTKDLEKLPSCFPFGIYTIPEVSMVGMNEEDAKEKHQPHLTGKAYYKDMPRGKIMGVNRGFLKLIFHKKTHQILGVHIVGHMASELIHYGVVLVEGRKTLQDVVSQVFNFPTLHDLYKYAAYDGMSIARGRKLKL